MLDRRTKYDGGFVFHIFAVGIDNQLICERKNWAQEGYAYNNLVVAWPEIQNMAAQLQAEKPQQLKMEF